MSEQDKAMPKGRCPVCGRSVFRGRECVHCHHWLPAPSEPGKRGKGLKCPICASYTLIDNRCGTCGARFVGNMANRNGRDILKRQKEEEERKQIRNMWYCIK